ncbi:MAG: ParB/RepB/Spo0J family partition protein [Patescibacteria group bacterium]|nr:ParB/RepB/Spo0J family partition protein [Patescibacteria group bacterium]
MIQKHGLGRGLSSLIPQKNTKAQTSSTLQKPHATKKTQTKKSEQAVESDANCDFVKEIPIGQVRANTQQPRLSFDEEKLDELSRSIKVHGVLQPLIAVYNGDHYELIAGERRLRASKKAGLTTVPVIVKNCDNYNNQKKLELALIENIQRHDLNVIEEAKSYQKLVDEFELTQEEIAVRSGKNRSVVANRIRLLTLPVDVQKGLIAGDITEGHAKVILSLVNPQKQIALYNIIIGQKLTVRQTEEELLSVGGKTHTRKKNEQTVHARRLEDQLTKYFDTKVKVNEGKNGGSITVSYFSQEELKNILSRLKLS